MWLKGRQGRDQSPERILELSAVDGSVCFTTPVTVPADRAEEVEVLGALLGDGYSVRVGRPGDEGVAVLGAVGPSAIAFLRLRHPNVALVVARRADGVHHSTTAVEYLNAGADAFVEASSPIELAAHIRSIARRRPLP